MGAPVRILDVATQLIAQSNAEITVEITGLRPAEKLHEALFGFAEDARPSAHPLISRVEVPPMDPAALGSLALSGSDEGVISAVRTLCLDGLGRSLTGV